MSCYHLSVYTTIMKYSIVVRAYGILMSLSMIMMMTVWNHTQHILKTMVKSGAEKWRWCRGCEGWHWWGTWPHTWPWCWLYIPHAATTFRKLLLRPGAINLPTDRDLLSLDILPASTILSVLCASLRQSGKPNLKNISRNKPQNLCAI
jgi:hypothetical protein